MIGRPSGIPFQDLCTMVGLLTLTWAWSETTLAMTLGIINEHAGPIDGHSEAPLSLKRRLKCFRATLRTVAALEPLQKEGSALAERFGKLSVGRNNFVHGAAWQTHEGAFESFAIGVHSGNYATKNHRFDVESARLLNVEVAKLQDDMAAFMLKVVALFQR
jgi:hypothetical protein